MSTVMHEKVMMSKNERGFSLLELLLVIAITASLSLVIVQLFDDFAKKSVNRDVANHILRVQNAAEEYVAANFTDIWTNDIPNLNDIVELDIVADLVADGFLPNGFRRQNGFRQELVIFARNVGASSGGDTIEVLTVGEDPAAGSRAFANERLLDAALAGGSRVGRTDNAAGTIRSEFGEWQVDLADFTPLFTYTGDNQNGYIAAYARVFASNSFNDQYLYRVGIAGRPDLNQMEIDLDMDQNAINAAGVVTVDSMAVGYNNYDPTNANPWAGANTAVGNIEIRAQNGGAGNFTPFALSIDQSIEVQGAADVGFRVTDAAVGAGCRIDAGGNVVANAGFPPATSCQVEGGDLVLREMDAVGPSDLSIGQMNVVSTDGLATTPATVNVGIASVTDINGPNYTANFNTVTVNGATNTGDFNTFVLNAGATSGGPTVPIDVFDTQQLQTAGANWSGNTLIGADTLLVGDLTSNGQISNVGGLTVDGNMTTTGGLDSRTITATENLFIGNTTGCNAANGCPAF